MAIIDVLDVTYAAAQFTVPAGPLSERKGLARWSAWLGKDPPPAPPQACRLQAALESPTAGSRFDQHLLPMNGWICSPRCPVEGIEVEGPDGRLERFKVQVPRPDIKPTLPDAGGAPVFGFQGSVTTLGLPLKTDLLLHAVLANRARVPVATVHLRRNRLPGTSRPGLQPLILNAFGHASAAWMMRLLREHPQVVVAGSFPYEVPAAQYWMRLLHLQAQLAPPERSARDLRCAPYPQVPALDQPSGTSCLANLAAAYQAQVETFYQQIAQSQGRTSPLRFAEKMHHGLAGRMLYELYPHGQELFLVRDFRDVFCSLPTGRQPFHSAEERIRHFARGVAEFYQSWRQRQALSLLVRYEDLLVRPHQVLQRLCPYLGLEDRPELIAGMVERAKQAGTAAELSVGHWRWHLSGEDQKRLKEVLGEYLAAFGYESDNLCRAA